jgi:hypothetical protein
MHFVLAAPKIGHELWARINTNLICDNSWQKFVASTRCDGKARIDTANYAPMLICRLEALIQIHLIIYFLLFRACGKGIIL